MKKLVFIILFLFSLYGVAFSAGNKIDRGATSTETTAQERDDVWLSPASIPYIKGRSAATIVIAASNSKNKEKADYICDGVDDDVQIQAAIDSTARARIVLLDGDFVISSPIKIKEKIWIQGLGERLTTLMAASGFTGNMFEFNSATVGGYQYETYISDLYAWGNNENCQFLDTENQHPTGTEYLQDVKLFNIAVLGFDGSTAIHIKPAWGFRGIMLAVEMNAGDALYIEGGENCNCAMIRQSQIHSNEGHGIILKDVSSSTVIGNEIGGGADHFGIKLINSYFINIVSNSFLALYSDTTGGAITMDGDSDLNIINSNTFNGGNLVAHGVVIDSGSVENAIINNSFLSYTVAEISDSGTGTLKVGNQSLTDSATRESFFPFSVGIGMSNPNYELEVNGIKGSSPQDITIADTGDANQAAYTLIPETSFVQLTCNDTDGCDITMGENGMASGAEVKIINVSANVCNFSDSAGVSELAGVFAMDQYDTLELVYATDRWTEVGRSNN